VSLPTLGLGGDQVTEPVAPAPAPAAITPTPTYTAPAPARPRAKRRSYGATGIGFPVALRIAVAVIVVAAVAIPLASVKNTLHSVKIPAFTFDNPATSTSPSAPSAPSAPRTVSYLVPRNLSAGLAHVLRIAPHAQLTLLRIDSHSLIVTASRHGATKEIYLGPNGTDVFSTGATGLRPISVSQIHVGAVGSLVAQMRARFHVPVGRIDYMVVSTPTGLPAQWVIFAKGAGHHEYTANLDGSALRAG